MLLPSLFTAPAAAGGDRWRALSISAARESRTAAIWHLFASRSTPPLPRPRLLLSRTVEHGAIYQPKGQLDPGHCGRPLSAGLIAALSARGRAAGERKEKTRPQPSTAENSGRRFETSAGDRDDSCVPPRGKMRRPIVNGATESLPCCYLRERPDAVLIQAGEIRPMRHASITRAQTDRRWRVMRGDPNGRPVRPS